MVVFFAIACFAFPCRAQELQPRRWSHLPMETNFGGIGYVYTNAEISFDPVLLIEDTDLDLHSFSIKYIRTFKFLGKSARVDLLQAYQDATWTGLLDGVPATARRSGWSDLSIRFAANLIGAPPLRAAEYKEYRAGLDRETIVGVGLVIQLPTGSYLEDKLLNLGTNRVTFRPQLGAVHRRNKWAFETTISSWIFTDNDDFFDGNLLEQEPLFAIQQHLDYTVRPGLWAGAGVAYAQGAESTVDGIRKDNETQNLAWLFSMGFPINRQWGVKFAYLGKRTLTSVGADSDSFVTAVSVLW
jgi:hypothetical protein